MTTTPARRSFKKNAGQNNHFLITVLVGLDSVRDGSAKLSAEFSTSWTPRNVSHSAARSREYVLRSSLAWITDLVDVYRSSVARMPGGMSAAKVSTIDAIDGRSLRLRELAKILGVDESPDEFLVRLAIYWRNRIVHSTSSSRLEGQVRAGLLASAKSLRDSHRGLDITRTIEHAKSGESPHFKEVASVIAAAHTLVCAIDEGMLRHVDLEAYAEEALRSHLSRRFEEGDRQVFARMWPGSPGKTDRRVRQFLVQSGLSALLLEEERSLPEQYLVDLCVLSASEARARFMDGRED